MEQHVDSIRSYLPVEFKEQETNDYITYLVSAYLENLPTEKFQFSYTAFHMLYMSYVFKVNWFLKQQGNVAIESSLNNLALQYKYTFNTLFDLSQINEKTSLEKLLLGLSFHVNDIGICKNFVDVRNNCSHASGKVYYKKATQVEHYILEAIENVEAIQKKVKPHIKNIFEKFIEDTWNTKWIEADIKEWILKNYLSQKELEEILQLKISFLKQNSDSKEIVFKKLLYTVFVSEGVKYLEEKGDYFINALNALMKGLPNQIDIKTNPDDSEKLKNTQEIIEEMILPILTGISNEEALKAQKILKLS
jgi:hypothetical protein